MYGKELILDIHNCDTSNFTRDGIEKFMVDLCKEIKMEREDLHFWDYNGDIDEYRKAPDHLKGTTAVQFIRTSNIVIHTLDVLMRAYINIFSCKDFDISIATQVCLHYFGGNVVNSANMDRV